MDTSTAESDQFNDSEYSSKYEKLIELRRIIMIGVAQADAGLAAPYSYEQMKLDLSKDCDLE